MQRQPTRRELLGASGFLLASTFTGCLGQGENGNGDGNNTGSNETRDSATTDGTEDVTEVSFLEEKSPIPDTREINPITDVDDVGVLAQLVAGNTAFASDVYRKILGDRNSENLIVSPYSISAALAMTRAGARGETAESLDEAMRYTLEGDSLHSSFASLRTEVNARNDTELGEGEEFVLQVVNAAWGQEDYPFLNEYLDTLETHYGAGLREVDYRSNTEAARKEINDRVANETEDKIEELLPENSLDEGTRLVLTNAVYLNASWATPFPENATSEAEFELPNGDTKDVQMMSTEAEYGYAENDGHQALELPYVGGDMSMVIVLPDENVDFYGFESSLDAPQLVEIVDSLETRKGSISVPRFGFESGFQLEDVLSELGAEIAFEADADFSGIADTDENLYIYDVYHDTFIEVDEKGTEASAATGVVVGRESATPGQFEMTVDRPFVFFIRDRRTGTVLFIGRVVNPKDPTED